MEIRLVALDLDDTLLSPDRTISERCLEAIAKARAKGVLVVLATGRMFRAAVGYALQLQLDTPVVAYQGAVIKKIDGEVLRSLHLGAGEARPVIELLEEVAMHANLYIDDELYVAEMNEVAERYASFSNTPVHRVGRLSAFPFEKTTKIIAIGDPAFIQDEVEPRAKRLFGHKLTINTSRPYFLEFGHPGATKSNALRFLGEKFGISPAQMMAVGDGANDLDMIQFAGLGIAMGNADEKVKAVAKHITAPNSEDGVALAIERFVL